MKQESQHINDEQLVKYITGELQAVEKSVVEQWLLESSENNDYYQQLKFSWESAETSYPPISVDSNAAWQKLTSRMVESEQTRELNTTDKTAKSFWFYALRVAAILVIAAFFYPVTQLLKSDSNETWTAVSSPYQDTLSDGSKITLNTGAELSYPSEFDKNQRKVKLKGEAFFDIEPDKQKPFIIESDLGFIRVLGTSFNVKAVSESDFEVSVETGLVQISMVSSDHKDTTSLLLEAGTAGFISYETHRLFKIENKNPAALFWLNKKLSFSQTPIIDVFKILEEAYQIQITIPESDLSHCVLSSKFENESLTSILEVIAATFNFQIETTQNDAIKVTANDPDCAEKDS